MNDDKMISLSLDEKKSDSSYYTDDVMTCEKCGHTTCEVIGRCPSCQGRMLNPAEFNDRTSAIKSGKRFIIFGFAFLILSLIINAKNFNFKTLIAKASNDAYLSVSLFSFIFMIPAALIIGGVTAILLKKDSMLIRFLSGGIVFAVFVVIDFVIFPFFR